MAPKERRWTEEDERWWILRRTDWREKYGRAKSDLLQFERPTIEAVPPPDDLVVIEVSPVVSGDRELTPEEASAAVEGLEAARHVWGRAGMAKYARVLDVPIEKLRAIAALGGQGDG